MQNPWAVAETPSEAEPTASQAVKALLALREMVLAGQLPAGQRIGEVAVAEQLGVSRTPIRAALMRLEQEGLLELLPGGGYTARSFSERDISDAIELRGVLEGLLARLAAERGAQQLMLGQARLCLDEIDQILAAPALDDALFSRYVELNERFHGLLHDLADSPVIAKELERVMRLPFASPSGFVIAQANSGRARDMLIVAQDQHRQVLEAIEQGEGARAQAIMCEHSRLAQRNLRAVGQSRDLGSLPGVRLIRRRST